MQSELIQMEGMRDDVRRGLWVAVQTKSGDVAADGMTKAAGGKARGPQKLRYNLQSRTGRAWSIPDICIRRWISNERVQKTKQICASC